MTEETQDTQVTSTLVEQPEIGDPTELIASLEAEKNEPVQEASTATPEQVFADANVPEKFRNKSLPDVIKSYQELESQLGRQGAELGELRKMTDEFIKTQLQQNKPPPEPEPDFYSEPDKAVRKLVEKELAPVQELIAETRRTKLDSQLRAAHDDYMDVVRSEDFQHWVTESPLRIELFARADRNYEVTSAVELLSMYKAMKGLKTSAPKQKLNPEEVAARDASFQKASLETGSVSEAPPQKIYRRSDILNLMKTNPTRYQALQPEIMAAYAEGRVR